jgi:hypothetical protein
MNLLDDDLPPTESYENSYLVPVATKRPFRDRSKTNNTDFVVSTNICRESSSPFSNEPYRNPQGETITLASAPLVTEDGQDTYLYPFARHNAPVDTTKRNNTPPILGLVNDTFWFFTTQGVVYETQMNWNDALRRYFPTLHAQLL